MATLTLQIDNSYILEKIKGVLSLIQGVHIISINRNATIEDIPNDTTLSAMKEAESDNDAGSVDTSSLQAFINSMN